MHIHIFKRDGQYGYILEIYYIVSNTYLSEICSEIVDKKTMQTINYAAESMSQRHLKDQY